MLYTITYIYKYRLWLLYNVKYVFFNLLYFTYKTERYLMIYKMIYMSINKPPSVSSCTIKHLRVLILDTISVFKKQRTCPYRYRIVYAPVVRRRQLLSLPCLMYVTKLDSVPFLYFASTKWYKTYPPYNAWYHQTQDKLEFVWYHFHCSWYIPLYKW